MTAAEQLQQELDRHRKGMKWWYRKVYLESAHWKQLRQQKFRASGKVCERCRASECLQIHHLRYRLIYDVGLGDLQVLCRRCHQITHGLSGSTVSKRAERKRQRKIRNKRRAKKRRSGNKVAAPKNKASPTKLHPFDALAKIIQFARRKKLLKTGRSDGRTDRQGNPTE